MKAISSTSLASECQCGWIISAITSLLFAQKSQQQIDVKRLHINKLNPGTCILLGLTLDSVCFAQALKQNDSVSANTSTGIIYFKYSSHLDHLNSEILKA